MEKRGWVLIVAGLVVFPVTWLVLVTAQGVYFGPMRSAFERISRRFLDDLPLGWRLFDVLFYLLPFVGIALVIAGLVVGRLNRKLFAIVFVILAVISVVAVRMWGPGYL